ncbi:MAG: metal ABC transporter permease [Eubacterium sp.]|nr:metal ABC transporter permease [Eubacterium sp.]
MGVWEKLNYYLGFSFVRYALIVGCLVALCSSLLGVTLVLKRYSFIGDGLSHVAFGVMAVAAVMKLANQTVLVMPVTILAAIVLLQTGEKARVKGDAAIAMVSVSSLALGYLIMNVFSASANVSGDVCSTLFGSTSILTLTGTEVTISVILSLSVILLYVLLYNRIFAVTFDENFVRATGMAAGRYNLVIAVIIAVIIVLGMNLVGSRLISALVIFPALSAMRLMYTFRNVVIFSAVLSVFAALLGMIISLLASTPVGSTIVVVDLAAYILCLLIGRMAKR